MLLLLAACADPDTTETGGKPGDTDTGADTTETGDTSGNPDGLFLSASGTANGESLTWSCDESSPGYAFYATVRQAGGVYALGGVCADTTGLYYAQIAATTEGPGSSTTCQPGQWGVAVLNLSNSQSWNCALDGAASLSVVIDELSPQDDGSVIWGGTFQATSDGSSTWFEADLSGAFRFQGLPG